MTLKSSWNVAEEKLIPRYLAIGFPVVRIAGEYHKFITVLKVKDDYWYDAFDLLAASARLIIVIPGATGGIVRELTTIRANIELYAKTMLYQPPVFVVSHGNVRNVFRGHYVKDMMFWFYNADELPKSSREEAWEAMTRSLQEIGFAVPDFEPKGQIVALNGSGSVVGFDPNNVQALIGCLPDGQSISKALRRLSEITKPRKPTT